MLGPHAFGWQRTPRLAGDVEVAAILALGLAIETPEMRRTLVEVADAAEGWDFRKRHQPLRLAQFLPEFGRMRVFGQADTLGLFRAGTSKLPEMIGAQAG